MKTFKLVSMTDFVIAQWDKDITREDFSQRMIKYATFLKQLLKLEMFIPCDEQGNVLEIPTGWGSTYDPENPMPDELLADYMEYKEAKEKVLFEGFKFIETTAKYHLLEHDSGENYHVNNIPPFDEILEDFVNDDFKLTLTLSAIKQLGI